MSGIHEKVCIACQADADPASEEEILQFVSSTDWSLINENGVTQLFRTYNFSDFENALIFTNTIILEKFCANFLSKKKKVTPSL